MTRFDLLVQGGTVVTPRGSFAADIGVQGEKIVAIGAPESLGADAAQTLDTHGRHVLPGVIDGHVHFREPGLEYKEDFLSGSRSAVMGGVTTVLEMPNTAPPTSSPERVVEKSRLACGRTYCDFGLFGLLGPDNLADLAGMAEAGVVGFKCFLGRSSGEIVPPDDGTLLEALATIARLGLRCAFHAENDQILQHSLHALQRAGRTDPLAHVASRPVIAEVESIQRVGLFAWHTGVKCHILHLSSADGLAMVQAWRDRGVDVSCEVTPHHAFLTSDSMATLGSVLRINPPVREPGHGEALLRGLAQGSVDAIATDHSPHLPAEKRHANIWRAVSGFAGVETSLRLFLTYAVHAGGLSLTALVRAAAEAPARIWGLYPRKGLIGVGSDADLTVIDLDLEDTIEASRLHGKNNLTPFEGCRTRGGAVATVLRGRVVMQDGELVGPPRGEMVSVARIGKA